MNSQHIAFTASNIEGELPGLVATLRALGLDVEAEEGRAGRWEVRASFPDPGEAEASRTRRAGARVTYSPWKSPVFNPETTLADGVAWLESHTPEEGMEALGCSRSTYFRWKAKARSALAEVTDLNARRAREGRVPIEPTLARVLQARGAWHA